MIIRHYILTPAWSLRGWKKLPYAAQSLYYPKTEFFGEADWALFSACDGQTDIDWDALTDTQRKRYEHWEAEPHSSKSTFSVRKNAHMIARLLSSRSAAEFASDGRKE